MPCPSPPDLMSIKKNLKSSSRVSVSEIFTVSIYRSAKEHANFAIMFWIKFSGAKRYLPNPSFCACAPKRFIRLLLPILYIYILYYLYYQVKSFMTIYDLYINHLLTLYIVILFVIFIQIWIWLGILTKYFVVTTPL
jgi:hypothetical protein